MAECMVLEIGMAPDADRPGMMLGRPSVLRSSTMRINGLMRSLEGVRRKLQALAAVAKDPGATEHEKANAEALKARLEQRLKEAGTPAGDWTDNAFRLGTWSKNLRKSASPASPKGDWTDDAYRLGRALRRGYKNWFSD